MTINPSVLDVKVIYERRLRGDRYPDSGSGLHIEDIRSDDDRRIFAAMIPRRCTVEGIPAGIAVACAKKHVSVREVRRQTQV